MMNPTKEERIQVLEMVASGRITPEQGNQLLDALGADRAPEVHQEAPHLRREQGGWGRREYGGSAFEDAMRSAVTGRLTGVRHEKGRRRKDRGNLEKITEARMHGVNPTYVQEMREAGYPNLTLDQLIELRMHGVNAEFIQEMRDAGYPDLDLRQLLHLRIHGVNSRFIQRMREANLGDLSLEELTELRMHGVNPEYIQEMQEMGFPDLSVDQTADTVEQVPDAPPPSEAADGSDQDAERETE